MPVEIRAKETGCVGDDLSQLLRVHPAWAKVIELCREIGYGELERVKIQDGLPVIVEVATRRIKLV